MDRSEQAKKTGRYVVVSLVLHGALFLFLVITNLVFPQKRELMVPSMQIDMVALPNQVKDMDEKPVDVSLPVKENTPPPKEAAKPEPEPEAVALPEKKETKKEAKKTVAKKDPEKAAKSALERLQEEMEERKAEENRKKRAQLDARKKDLERFAEATRNAIRGNQVNQGNSNSGDMKATADAYSGHIRERIRSNWGLPTWLQGKGLRAVVVIYIDGNGRLANYRFVQSSGNEAFDNYVKTALQRSNPFAPPPADMVGTLRGGLEVLFPL